MTVVDEPVEYAPYRFPLDPDRIKRFTALLGLPAGRVPTVFAVTAVPAALQQALAAIDPPPRAEAIRHAEQVIRVDRRFRDGEVLTARAKLECAGDYGFQHGLTVRVSLVDDGGAGVAELVTTLTTGPATGRARLRRAEPPVATGEVVARWDERVPADLPARYARASGDTNPIHLDDAAARRAGLPGVVLPGMATFLLAVTGTGNRLYGGDELRLGEIHARFAHPVAPGDVIAFTVRATGTAGVFHLGAAVGGRAVLKDSWFAEAKA